MREDWKIKKVEIFLICKNCKKTYNFIRIFRSDYNLKIKIQDYKQIFYFKNKYIETILLKQFIENILLKNISCFTPFYILIDHVVYSMIKPNKNKNQIYFHFSNLSLLH